MTFNCLWPVNTFRLEFKTLWALVFGASSMLLKEKRSIYYFLIENYFSFDIFLAGVSFVSLFTVPLVIFVMISSIICHKKNSLWSIFSINAQEGHGCYNKGTHWMKINNHNFHHQPHHHQQLFQHQRPGTCIFIFQSYFLF